MKHLIQLFLAASLGLPAAALAQNVFPPSGNSGVGTTNPQALFQVGGGTNRGVVRVEGTTSSAPAIMLSDKQPGGHIYNLYSGGVAAGGLGITDVSSGNATRFLIASNGNVGIGTQIPQAQLNVVGSTLLNGNLGVEDGASFGVAHWTNQGEGFSYRAITTFGGANLLGDSINVGKFTIGAWEQVAPGGGLYVAGGTVLKGDVRIDGATTFSGPVNLPTTSPLSAGSFYSPGFVAYPNAGGAIELGVSGRAGSTPFIDFHHESDAADADNNMRIINNLPHTLSVEGGSLAVAGNLSLNDTINSTVYIATNYGCA